MTDYIESLVGDEGKILIEVTPSHTSVGFGQNKEDDSKKKPIDNAFNHALNTIQLAASSVLETLNTLEERPDTARLDFAIKFDPDAGAMIAEAESKAQLRVSLTWQTKSADDDKEKGDKAE